MIERVALASDAGRDAHLDPGPSARPSPPTAVAAARPLRPAAPPRRRRRRPGHVGDRHRPGRDGPPRVGQRPPRAAGARPGAGGRRDGARRPRSPRTSTACDAVTSSTAIPETQHRAARHARELGIPALRRAGMLAVDLRPGALRRRRRHARQDHHHVDAHARCWPRPGWRRASSSAATSPTPAPGRSGPAASCSSSRPTRATAPTSSCRCTPRSCTNVEVDHLDHYGTFDAIIDGFDRYLVAHRRAQGAVRRRPASARDLADRHGAITYGLRAGRRRARRRRAPRAAARSRSPSSATASALGTDRACRCAACTTSSTPPGRWRWRSSSACRSTTVAAALGPLRRRGPALRHPRRRRRRHVRRRLRPPADRDRRRARRGPRERRRLGAGRSPSSSPTASTASSEMSRRLRRRLRRRRRGGAHRDLRVGHDADPRGHRPARRQRRRRRPSRTPTSCGCRGATTWCRSWPARSAPATCASRWAAATSPRSPRRCSPAGRPGASRDSRGRRRGGGTRRAGGGGARRAGRARRAARAAHHLPTGWSGGAARAAANARRPASASPRARQASGLPVLVVGRGSNLFVADAGFAGIAVSVAAARRRPHRGRRRGSDGRRGRRRGGAACGRPAAGVGRAGGVRVGRRRARFDRRRGAHERRRARLRHGGVPRHGDRVRPAHRHRREAATRRRSGCASAASDLTDDDVVVSAAIGVRAGDRADAEAELAEIVRWRRENQPGGQNAGSVFVNPVPGEVSAGSLIDGLGLRGFRIGSAWVSEKHANFIQGSDAGIGRRRPGGDRGGPRPRRRRHGLRPAQRGPPGGVPDGSHRMIRRRKRDDSAPAPPAPTPPAGVSGEPALGSPPAVPTADADEPPSAAVLDELLAVVRCRRAHHAAAPSGRRHRARGAGRRCRRWRPRPGCRRGERSEGRGTGLGRATSPRCRPGR